MTTTETHPFSAFGPAPYRIVKVQERVHKIDNEHFKAGSTCDVCGSPIRWEYTVRSGSGTEFHVGCDCAQKCGMSAKELAEAKRSYMRDARSAKRRESMRARESAEREANGGLTNAETREATAIGSDAARRWLESERLVEASHVGAPKQRLRGLWLRVDFATGWETQYGYTMLYVMRDSSGNAFTWKTSSVLGLSTDDGFVAATRKEDRVRLSAWVKVDATVKSHGQHNGLRQTELTRVRATDITELEPVTETRFLRAG